MAVVIDEVIISVEVTNRMSGGKASPPSEGEDKQAVVRECVERVLDILRQKTER